ncbi:DNA-binding transcriptional regulator, Lrp family [Amphibacillus marinus]|uniref:DNA-binding transcriptional regulator, Lrp family n=1 Tax=Amphibacillus marinus TaxID=872970 RepID=A0A1H8KJV0_9BACI|nr:Lrp/AsnC family transcriptional regulator [Amphibacillus marinus]SEN92688.1 DNA-binding transcriptional regulator, Lrp family [Amphibacillus marinus]
MDEINRKIINILQEEGRTSMTELGMRIALSVPAVTERVRKLEDQGVIQGYKAIIDPDKINKAMKAFVLVKTNRCQAFKEFCLTTADVVECHRLTGEYSYLVKIITHSNASLEAFIDATMAYGQPYTMISLSSPLTDKII